MLGLLATFNSPYSSPSLAFWAAMAWAGDCTVCDWRNEMREAFDDVFAPPLLMIGLFGGIGGGTRADEATPNWPFFIGGCGAVACCTLWARMIVATLEPLVIALELSWRSTWPGDIDRAIPVAKNDKIPVAIYEIVGEVTYLVLIPEHSKPSLSAEWPSTRCSSLGSHRTPKLTF